MDNSKNMTTGADDSQLLIYDDYIAQIIQQIPNPGKLRLLKGTSNAQASFFFKSSSKPDINATLYNNQINQTIRGAGEEYGVEQVELTNNSFTNDYLSVYLKIIYNLSQADRALQQRQKSLTDASIATLTPIWNAWVDQFGGDTVNKLDPNDTLNGLITMTGTLNSVWLNPEYLEILIEDPSYPYTHLKDFNKIYNKIPLTVPAQMRALMVDTFNAQGAAGALIAQVSNATMTLAGIRDAIEQPTTGEDGNGGLPLDGGGTIPGLIFQPDQPLPIAEFLASNPPQSSLKYKASIVKSTEDTLTFNASTGGGINIPFLSFFSMGLSGGASTSIFKSNYAGSNFNVEVIINNAFIQPNFSINPLLYNISTTKGWFATSPIREAINNGSNNDVTGYIFTSPPSFDFGEGGDFGFINTMIFSQFMELNLTFEECDVEKVKEYFEVHAKASISFLGIPLGGASSSSSYEHNFSSETSSSITVTLKPNAPGYTPGTSDITQSLSGLLAVGVEYPLS